MSSEFNNNMFENSETKNRVKYYTSDEDNVSFIAAALMYTILLMLIALIVASSLHIAGKLPLYDPDSEPEKIEKEKEKEKIFGSIILASTLFGLYKFWHYRALYYDHS